MRTKILSSILLCIVLIAIGGVLYFFWPYLEGTPNVQLSVIKMPIEVNAGSGWRLGVDGEELIEGWSVRTGPNGSAVITFFADTTSRLDENAEVRIQGIFEDEAGGSVWLEQSSGDVWHTIGAIGLTHFAVDTPSGRFEDEGTSFGLSVSPTMAYAPVLRGSVRTNVVTSPPLASFKRQASFQNAGAGKTQISITPGTVGSCPNSGENTARDTYETPLQSWVDKNEEKDAAQLIKRREQLKKKYSRNIGLGKRLLGKSASEDSLNSWIDDYLKGNTDVSKLIKDGTIPSSFRTIIPAEFLKKVKPVKPDKPVRKTCTCACGPSCSKTFVYGCPTAENAEKSGGSVNEFGKRKGTVGQGSFEGIVKKGKDGKFTGECTICKEKQNFVDVTAMQNGDCSTPCKQKCKEYGGDLKVVQREAGDECRAQLQEACGLR